MGAFCCHGNQSVDPVCPKSYAAFPAPQWYYTKNLIKIVQLALEIFKFESVDDDGRRTDDGPLVYYKLYTISSHYESSAQVS